MNRYKTNGVIKNVQYDPKQPDLALISSNMVQLPGDSGCPWYTSEDRLVGIGSSSDQEWKGGDAGSQAQPIRTVIDMIRGNGGRLGRGFQGLDTVDRHHARSSHQSNAFGVGGFRAVRGYRVIAALPDRSRNRLAWP